MPPLVSHGPTYIDTGTGKHHTARRYVRMRTGLVNTLVPSSARCHGRTWQCHTAGKTRNARGPRGAHIHDTRSPPPATHAGLRTVITASETLDERAGLRRKTPPPPPPSPPWLVGAGVGCTVSDRGRGLPRGRLRPPRPARAVAWTRTVVPVGELTVTVAVPVDGRCFDDRFPRRPTLDSMRTRVTLPWPWPWPWPAWPALPPPLPPLPLPLPSLPPAS